MRSTVPTLAIRFAIDALNEKDASGLYGRAAWTIVDGAVDLSSIEGQTSLFEGDSLDSEFVFCIVFQNPNQAILDGIQASIEGSSDFNEVADSSPILTDTHRERIVALPLVHCADISDGEVNVLKNSLLRHVLANRRRAERASLAEQAHVSIPERSRPASNRTASLPAFSSRAALVAFLDETFSVPNIFGQFATPEELCDMVEKYQDVTKAFLCYGSGECDDLQVHLVAQTDVDEIFGDSSEPSVTDRGICFSGLTEFASDADAVSYCKNSIGDEGCVATWKIEGRYALNFYIYEGMTETVDPSHPVSADELWAEMCKRLATFDLVNEPDWADDEMTASEEDLELDDGEQLESFDTPEGLGEGEPDGETETPVSEPGKKKKKKKEKKPRVQKQKKEKKPKQKSEEGLDLVTLAVWAVCGISCLGLLVADVMIFSSRGTSSIAFIVLLSVIWLTGTAIPFLLWKGRQTNTAYVVFLGISLAGILIANLLLLLELASYGGDIGAKGAQARMHVTPAVQSAPDNTSATA